MTCKTIIFAVALFVQARYGYAQLQNGYSARSPAGSPDLSIGSTTLPAEAPAFSSASVNVSTEPRERVRIDNDTLDSLTGKWLVPATGGQVTLRNWTLGDCISAAWGLSPGQVKGMVGMNSARYDINAQTSAQTTQAELQVMLQALLDKRFGLVVHRQTMIFPVNMLVPDRNGTKLTASVGAVHMPVIFTPPTNLIAQGSTIHSLAMVLGRLTGLPAGDQTGIQGTFDFTLDFSPEAVGRKPGARDDQLEPPLTLVLREKLGLRLNPWRVSGDILVVDHWDAPVAE